LATTKTVHRKRPGKTRLEETREEAGPESPPLAVPVDLEHDHVQGPSAAALTLVEYGDYQCPYCGAAYPEVKRVQKELGNKVRFIFRNFPLTRMHEYALNAAETAEAAGAQGKFWEMHDFLYEHQSTLNDPQVALGFAKKLGLDTQKFQQELSQHKYQSRIKEDFNGGVRSGVNGTPTFYVNGFRHDGEATATDLVKALEQPVSK
jgi:protein-disulfide isomerase